MGQPINKEAQDLKDLISATPNPNSVMAYLLNKHTGDGPLHAWARDIDRIEHQHLNDSKFHQGFLFMGCNGADGAQETRDAFQILNVLQANGVEIIEDPKGGSFEPQRDACPLAQRFAERIGAIK